MSVARNIISQISIVQQYEHELEKITRMIAILKKKRKTNLSFVLLNGTKTTTTGAETNPQLFIHLTIYMHEPKVRTHDGFSKSQGQHFFNKINVVPREIHTPPGNKEGMP